MSPFREIVKLFVKKAECKKTEVVATYSNYCKQDPRTIYVTYFYVT